jgi:hypothetical protein
LEGIVIARNNGCLPLLKSNQQSKISIKFSSHTVFTMATTTRKAEDPVQKGQNFLQSEEDSLSSPIDVVEAAGIEKYAKDLAFMAEEVEVMILDSYDPEDTTKYVDISVNGKSYYFMRGEWRTCPRFVLEILATAKVQAWNFGYKRAPNGTTVQTSSSTHILRYPHHYRDKNPEGAAWYDSLKDVIR